MQHNPNELNDPMWQDIALAIASADASLIAKLQSEVCARLDVYSQEPDTTDPLIRDNVIRMYMTLSVLGKYR